MQWIKGHVILLPDKKNSPPFLFCCIFYSYWWIIQRSGVEILIVYSLIKWIWIKNQKKNRWIPLTRRNLSHTATARHSHTRGIQFAVSPLKYLSQIHLIMHRSCQIPFRQHNKSINPVVCAPVVGTGTERWMREMNGGMIQTLLPAIDFDTQIAKP